MIDEALREFVRRRAGDRCEYCRLPQHAVDGRFHDCELTSSLLAAGNF